MKRVSNWISYLHLFFPTLQIILSLFFYYGISAMRDPPIGFFLPALGLLVRVTSPPGVMCRTTLSVDTTGRLKRAFKGRVVAWSGAANVVRVSRAPTPPSPDRSHSHVPRHRAACAVQASCTGPVQPGRAMDSARVATVFFFSF
jgi:hypothetical protein